MAESIHSITYYNNEPMPGREVKNLPAIFTPKRRDAGNKKQDSHRNAENHKNSKPSNRKEVNAMKGLEIAVIIIGCGMKILEVLEEA